MKKSILIIIFILLTVSSYAGKYSTTVNAADEYGNTPLSKKNRHYVTLFYRIGKDYTMYLTFSVDSV